MHNNEIHKFLKGESNLQDLKNSPDQKDFIDSYRKIIEQDRNAVPDFNPFAKIETGKKKKIMIVKRILPYAATVLIVISTVLVYLNFKTNQTERIIREAELVELQKNTSIALLYFSKEINVCMAKFEDAKEMQQPVSEIQALKQVNINLYNPTKNLKIH